MAGFLETTATITLVCAAITAVICLGLMLGFAVQGIVRSSDPAPVRRAGIFAGVVFLDVVLLLMFGSLWGDESPLSTALVAAGFGLIALTTLSMARNRELRQIARSHDEIPEDEKSEATDDR